jgi:hypothetical protein
MYEEHPVFLQPDDEEVKVWRYMDFTKLISLIDSRRLYFTRADKFNDPFEGSYPKINVLSRSQIPESITKNMTDEKVQNMIEGIKKSFETNKHWPRYTAINCWHMNNHESAAMWKLYLKSDEGVAIQSTYSKLKKSMTDDEKIFLGVVKYLDYDSDFFSSGNVLSPFVHKRKSFEHEREVRALCIKFPIRDKNIDFNQDTIDYGIAIKTDLEVLIEKIYIAPNASVWFSELVRSAVNRYGYSFEIVHSKLNDSPLF